MPIKSSLPNLKLQLSLENMKTNDKKSRLNQDEELPFKSPSAVRLEADTYRTDLMQLGKITKSRTINSHDN